MKGRAQDPPFSTSEFRSGGLATTASQPDSDFDEGRAEQGKEVGSGMVVVVVDVCEIVSKTAPMIVLAEAVINSVTVMLETPGKLMVCGQLPLPAQRLSCS